MYLGSWQRGRSPCALALLLTLLLWALAAPGCMPVRIGHRWVKDVELKGADALEAGDVLSGLETQEMSWYWYWLWWMPWVDRAWYDPDVVLADLDRVETYYAANGFFEARVTGHKASIPRGDDTASVEFTVKEGPATKVTAVEITGLPALKPEQARRLKERLGLKQGERFNYGAYSLAKEVLATRLKELGYAYCRVEGLVEVHRPRRSAVIRLKVSAGPLVRFGATRFEGHGDFPEQKLRLLVRWEQGQVYDQEKVRKTRSALFKLRVFSAVRVDLPEQPMAVAPITIRVQPAQLKELRLGLGMGLEAKRHELRLSGRWTWRNFLGGLRVLELKVIPAFVSLPTFWDSERLGPAVETELKLTQPYLFNSRFSAFALVGYDLDIHEGYQYHGIKAQAGLDRPFWRERLWAGLSYNFQLLDFFDINDEAFKASDTGLGFGFIDPYRPAWLEQYAELDLRDSVSSPRSGFYASVRLEEGFEYIASDFTYIKVTPEVRGYIPLGTKRLVLALRGLFGYLYPMGSPDAGDLGYASSPITRRYTLGGPNSHRGFSYGRLSPQGIDPDTGERVPLGGHAALLLSADLRVRVVKLLGYWFSVVAFFDAGDVTEGISDLELDSITDGLHLAAGGGITFETPIGSLRFSVGGRINRMAEKELSGRANPDPGDWGAFHFTLGDAY